MREFLFKLDIIAPMAALLLSSTIIVIRKGFQTFSDYTLVLFLAFQIILNLLAGVMQSFRVNNLLVYFTNCIAIFTIFSFYFSRVLSKKKVLTGILTFAGVVLLLIFAGDPYHKFPSYLYSVGSFIIVLYCLFFLRQLMDTLRPIKILRLKEFWLVAGALTYFGSSFFIFISYKYLSEVSPKNVFILWQFHNIFLSFGCILFFKAITCKQWILK